MASARTRSPPPPTPRLLARAADCVLAALVEAVASARDPRWERGALALAPTRRARDRRGGRPSREHADAVAANSFLIHATLSDDAYRLALHPGLAVVPAALARAEETGASRRGRPAGGRSAATRSSAVLADAVLPTVSERGFRITAAIAPSAVAATIALLDGLPAAQAGAEALRLAAGAAGGGLRTVDAVGEGWSLQPALATGTGIAAVRAATAGLQGAAGIVEARNGMQGTLCGGPGPVCPRTTSARIHRVTFKEHPVAMYGQAIFDAVLRGGTVPAGTDAITVVVPIVRRRLRAPGQLRRRVRRQRRRDHAQGARGRGPVARTAITVVGDEALGPLDATRRGGRRGRASAAATRAAGGPRTSPRTR